MIRREEVETTIKPQISEELELPDRFRPLPYVELCTQMFLQRIKGVLSVPTIIRTTPEQYDAVKQQITNKDINIKREMRLFNMIALDIPTSVVGEVIGIEGVQKIYYDQDVGVPEFPLSYTEGMPQTLLDLVDIERIRSRPILQKGFREESLTNVVPTSVSRKIMEADIADDEGITGNGVKIAIIDTGVSRYNPQTAGIPSKTITRERKDSSGHGSHTTSTAVGSETTHKGLVCVGVAHGAKSSAVHIKALSTPIGMGKSSDIIKAMETAYVWGAKIVSMSLGSSECQGDEDCVGCPTCEAVKTLTDAGVIVVVAVGNSGPEENTIGCPGCSPDALTVGAVDIDGVIAEFSSRGPTFDGRIKPDVVAPGVDIYSGTSFGSFCDVLDKRPDAFASLSGSSMSTPHVAGLVCLIVELFNKNGYDITTEDIKKIMEKHVDYIKDNIVGWGVPRFTIFKKVLEEQT